MKNGIRGALALLLMLLASPLQAVDLQNNQQGNTRTTVAPGALFYWNGSRWVAWNGATHDYFGDESAVQIVGGGVLDTCQVGKANTANPLTAASLTQYSVTGKYLWANVTVTGITSGYPWSVRFYGSRDGATFAPLMRSTGYWVTGGGAPTADDTLKITRRAPTGANGVWIPLTSVSGPIIANQIVAVCSNDSGTATVGSRATFVVTIAQRK